MFEFVLAPDDRIGRAPETRNHQASFTPARDSNSKRELDRRLDQALEETFPASDPVSIVIC
jgi:hypothetical protein